MRTTFKVNDRRQPRMTKEFGWDQGIDELIGLVKAMSDCSVRYRDDGLESGTTVAFYYGDIDEWNEVRFSGSREEMTHLIRLVNMFTQIMNDSADARKLEPGQVFGAICTWIVRRSSGVVDGPFALHGNLHYHWQMLRIPLLQILKGEVQFPE